MSWQSEGTMTETSDSRKPHDDQVASQQKGPRPARAPEEKLGRALGWLAGKAVVSARKTKVWQQTQRAFDEALHGEDEPAAPNEPPDAAQQPSTRPGKDDAGKVNER